MSVYDNMNFPTYEFREYPKWIYPEGQDPVLVQDPDQESRALGVSVKRGPGRPPKVSAE